MSLSTTALGPRIGAEEVIRKAKAKFESLQTFSADFEQVFQWKLTNETQRLTGTLYWKQGDKYRIETQDQIIVTDGKSVWTYSKPNQQVVIEALDRSKEAVLPRDLLLKYSEEYRAQLTGEAKVGDSDCYVLKLSPKAKEAFTVQLMVWVDRSDWIPRKVQETDINGNVNTYALRQVKLKPPLPESLFTFAIPKGAEIIDLR